MTTLETKALVEPGRRIREYAEVSKLPRKGVEADAPPIQSKWGKYTHNIGSALPGRHTLRLHGTLSHEDARVVMQARTGHAHLNEFLARSKKIDISACACEDGAESVKHVLLQRTMGAIERRR
ncbi:Hypothetical protein D9617_66g010510 [Elsinoe fawcettii]|nr:Hypothetical protein D9617_66g010510 [Elsinoe fawcettii]